MFNSVMQRIRSARNKKLFCFGSSSAEAIDYIFGSSDAYFSLWASGISARRLPEMLPAMDAVIGPFGRGQIALNVSGVSDVLFHMQHVANAYGDIDPEEVVETAVAGLAQFERFLKKKGFSYIAHVFFSPLTPLDGSYWTDRFGIATPLPNPLLARTLEALACRASSRLQHSINLLGDLTLDGDVPYLRDEFKRDEPNHHPDYVKIRSVIWEALKTIPGIPDPLGSPVEELQPHLARDFDDVFTFQNPVVQRLRSGKP